MSPLQILIGNFWGLMVKISIDKATQRSIPLRKMLKILIKVFEWQVATKSIISIKTGKGKIKLRFFKVSRSKLISFLILWHSFRLMKTNVKIIWNETTINNLKRKHSISIIWRAIKSQYNPKSKVSTKS